MKTRQRCTIALCALILILAAACEEDDLPVGQLETTPPAAAFTATPSAQNANYIVLQNNSEGQGLFSAWRFQGDRDFVRDATTENDTAYYPEAGQYTITLLVGNDAGVDSISTTVTVNQRDPDLPDPTADNFLLLGDFEDGEVGDWNAWGQDVTVADNPAPNAVNASAKVLKMTQTSAFEHNANRSIPVVTENAKKITIDVYFEVSGSLKLQIEEDFATGFFQDVAAGSWVTLTYNLEGIVNADTGYPWLLIQGNCDGSYYIDNITYFE